MKKAIIIGAGPAGLTAAYQLLKETDIHPIIIEESEFIGGIYRFNLSILECKFSSASVSSS